MKSALHSNFSDYGRLRYHGILQGYPGSNSTDEDHYRSGATPAAYNTLQNGDYATTKGMELHLTMRRVARIQAQLNYNSFRCAGDRTEPYSAVSSVETRHRPTVISR